MAVFIKLSQVIYADCEFSVTKSNILNMNQLFETGFMWIGQVSFKKKK